MDTEIQDNTNLEQCRQCKTCAHKDKTVFRGIDFGYTKCFCDVYTMKPDEIMWENKLTCRYYQEEK